MTLLQRRGWQKRQHNGARASKQQPSNYTSIMTPGETQSASLISPAICPVGCSWPSLPALPLLSTETASQPTSSCAPHSQGSWELNSCLVRTCISVLHNTHVFPQGFSALPTAVPPSLPMAGICSCSISSTQELNYQDRGSSGNGDSSGRNSYKQWLLQQGISLLTA